MPRLLRLFAGFSLILLMIALLFGVIASGSFMFPELLNGIMPFQKMRPFHVSAALFWILSGAGFCVLYFRTTATGRIKLTTPDILFMSIWTATIISIFAAYFFGLYGGREYWEFPPALNFLLLLAWIFYMIGFFKSGNGFTIQQPLYVWMWATGILFFLFTFIEQNLWQIPWFRASFLREMTIQWKSSGSMVGAWNQIIYGLSLYLMVKISGDAAIAKSRAAYFAYFLGLTNLIFNWGHHIYNVPSASFIRVISYGVSMTEWILLIKIIHGFRKYLTTSQKYLNTWPYRFLFATEMWIGLNLLLALLMSIPAINRFTHGTHITVAHAMGTTIGINTMILLACFCKIFDTASLASVKQKIRNRSFWVVQISLLLFWLSLIAAGCIKGYRSVYLNIPNFTEMMQPVYTVLWVFVIAGTIHCIAMLILLSSISFRNKVV